MSSRWRLKPEVLLPVERDLRASEEEELEGWEWEGVTAPEGEGERGREAALKPSQSWRTPMKEKSRLWERGLEEEKRSE